MIKKIALSLWSMVLIIIFAQFSSQSVDGGEKPKVNFKGTVIDKNDPEHPYDVENITISGLYKQIPVYKKPPRKNMNPNTNETRIDLDEIREIRVPYQGEMPNLSTYQNRQYIEIEVISNDSKQTKNSYIIETNRKLWCDSINEAGPEEKRISFETLDRVIIKGYEDRCPKNNKKNKNTE